MDFFFDGDVCLPSSHDGSQETTSHRIALETEESQNMTEDTDSSRAKSSNMPESEEYTRSIDDIGRRLHELVESMNVKRATDPDVLDGYQKKLVEKVTEMCEQMKAHLYTIYEENSREINVKLQEVTRVLGNCTKLNSELVEARQALTRLRV